MVAEDFYNVKVRAQRGEKALAQVFTELKDKGIAVDHVLMRQYYYNHDYQQQIEEKKVQDQLKFTRASEAEAAKELAKKQEIESTGRATVEIETQRGNAEVTKIQAEADAYRRKRVAEADLLVQLANAQGAELENRAYQGGGSENLVGMKMAEVLEGVDTVLVPSGGKGGMNPLDLNQALRLFDVAPEGGEAVSARASQSGARRSSRSPRAAATARPAAPRSASRSASSSAPTRWWRRDARCWCFPSFTTGTSSTPRRRPSR